MSIKRFTGIGDIDLSTFEFSPDPVLGNLNTPSAAERLVPGFDSEATHADPGKVLRPTPASTAPQMVHPGRRFPKPSPQILSNVSAPAPYETIFHDLDFDAIPFYNFWTEDEDVSRGEPLGDRKLEDVPRFIKLVWKTAPDLPVLMGFSAKSKLGKTIRTVKFGLETRVGTAATVKGISFTTKHLDPKHFDLVVRSLANGHVSPGVLHTLVELPKGGFVRPKNTIFDEDVFLTHPDTKGLSVHEIRTNVDQVSNGTLGTVRPSSTDGAGSLLGSFSVSNITRVGENSPTVEIRDLSSSPSLSLVAKTASPLRPAPDDGLTSIVRSISVPTSPVADGDSLTTKVSFVDPAVGGLVSEDKVQGLSRPEHAENIFSLSAFLPNLEILSKSGIHDRPRKADIPSFASPLGVPPLEYVGYVVEKYRRLDTGAFELVKEILVPSRETSLFYDCEIKYGEMYRYRIRAILRWTRPADVEQDGKSKFIVSQHGSQTSALLPLKSSYFGGEWNRGWRYATCVDNVPPAPPDELYVRPDSARRRIVVTFKLPDDSQRDIQTLRLYRKTQDLNGHDLTDWQQVGKDFGARNVLYYDEDVALDSAGFPDPSVRYVYAGATISKHAEVSFLSEQLGVRLNPDYKIRGEYEVDFVSCAGVRLEYVGAFSVNPVRRDRSELLAPVPSYSEDDSEPRALLGLSGRTAAGTVSLIDSQYVIRVESLDTGETRDTLINITYNNQKERVDRQVAGALVQKKSRPRPLFKRRVMTASVARPSGKFTVRR